MMPGNTVKRFFSTCVLIFIFAGLPFEQAHANLEIGTLLDEAGQQRMLSQRIVKAYLMLAADINPVEAQRQLDSSIGKFAQNLSKLLTFAPNDKIRNELEKVEDLWRQFRISALSTASEKTATEFLQDGESLLRHSQSVVDEITEFSGVKAARIVALSGRQRMLCQRIAKYYIAYYYGLRTGQITESFNKAVQEYETALQQLMKHKGNTSDIQAKLKKVNSQWIFSKVGIKNFPKGGELVPFIISVTTESMLVKMHEITGLYARLLDRQMK